MDFQNLSFDGVVAAISDFLARTPGTIIGFIVLAAVIAAAMALHALIGAVLRRVFARRPFVVTLLARTRGPSLLALAIFVTALVLPALPINADIADAMVRLLGIVFVVLLGWIALIAVDLAASVYLMRFRVDTADNLLARKHITQVRILKRVATTIVVIFTVGAALMTFEAVRQYGVSLFASAGAAGLILGFAARPLLSNLMAGVQLAVTQPIRIDDAVIVENEWGVIEEITATYVVVRIWDLRRLIVPLTYFIEKPFQNWTRDSTDIIGAVTIRADYAAPVERVREKLDEIVKASPLWDRRTAVLQVTDAGERTIELRALVSAASAGAAFDLRCEVREKLIAYLRDECPDALPHDRPAVPAPPPQPREQAAPMPAPRRVAGA